ncbi:hypothetical protein [Pseudomonas sp. DSV-1]|uniref:hypothetical protein n=1 Tax=Pseudomonas sp. DSV-1 TaxID=3112250 RepID=UPI002DC036FC|nr:hypothetical protein [Pseudomonas sp. DSV-1]MEC4239128.1 hypothetical protein [Pseudomonas sp. DSV-1]
MADHSELMRLVESLNRAIEQAEHKPGQWAETAQSMGGICCAGEPFQIGKPWAKEEPWAHFSYKRDSWLAVAAVNALPQLIVLIAENEALKGLYRMHQQTETREMRDLKAEIAGLKTRYEAFEQVNAGLKAEVARSTEREILQLAEIESLRKDAERYQWLRIADWWRSPVCVIRNPKEQAKLGSDCPSGDRLDAAIDAAMGKGEQS